MLVRIEDMIDRPPNILLIQWAGLGRMLGICGERFVHSPWVDTLAYQGMLFTNTWLADTRMDNLSILYGAVDNTDAPLPLILRQAGYTTHTCGSHRSDAELQQLGFQDIRAGNQHIPKTIEAAETVARELAAADAPFFLNLWLRDTVPGPDGTLPFEAHPDLVKELVVPEQWEDTPEMRETLARYYAAIGEVDFYLGRFFDDLEDRGIEDDTLVVLMADSGPAIFPGLQTSLSNADAEASLILRWSSILPGGYTMDHLVSSLDLAPTLATLAGIEQLPGSWTGTSFKHWLDGQYEPIHQSVTCTNGHDTRTIKASHA